MVDVTEVIPAKEEYFGLYKEKVPALADLVSYLDSSTPFSYPTPVSYTHLEGRQAGAGGYDLFLLWNGKMGGASGSF